jgi:hypothetical protein
VETFDDSRPTLFAETESRLEAIVDALPRMILREFDPRKLFWLAHALGHFEHLFGSLLLEIIAKHSNETDAPIDREIFRKSLRNLLAPLKEFSDLPSFDRLMFHATGNQDFGTVEKGTESLVHLDESYGGEAIETISELEVQMLGDPDKEQEAVHLLARLHMIAREAANSRARA